MRCEEAEKIKEEITSSIIEASKPLYRDIESLRAAHEASRLVWENMEFSFVSLLLSIIYFYLPFLFTLFHLHYFIYKIFFLQFKI